MARGQQALPKANNLIPTPCANPPPSLPPSSTCGPPEPKSERELRGPLHRNLYPPPPQAMGRSAGHRGQHGRVGSASSKKWHVARYVTPPHFQTPCVSCGLTRFGIETKHALLPDCGVHCLWFAYVCFLARFHPPLPPLTDLALVCGGRLGLRVPASGAWAVLFFFLSFLCFFCEPHRHWNPPMSPSAAVGAGQGARPDCDVWQGGLLLRVPTSGRHTLPHVPTCGLPHTNVNCAPLSYRHPPFWLGPKPSLVVPPSPPFPGSTPMRRQHLQPVHCHCPRHPQPRFPVILHDNAISMSAITTQHTTMLQTGPCEAHHAFKATPTARREGSPFWWASVPPPPPCVLATPLSRLQ